MKKLTDTGSKAGNALMGCGCALMLFGVGLVMLSTIVGVAAVVLMGA